MRQDRYHRDAVFIACVGLQSVAVVICPPALYQGATDDARGWRNMGARQSRLFTLHLTSATALPTRLLTRRLWSTFTDNVFGHGDLGSHQCAGELFKGMINALKTYRCITNHHPCDLYNMMVHHATIPRFQATVECRNDSSIRYTNLQTLPTGQVQ